MAAPTRIDYQEADWSTTTTPKDSASITWQTGDVIIALMGCASSDIPALPTATGLTFLSLGTSATKCGSRIAYAIAAGNGSSVVSSSVAGGDLWGFGVWVYRGSAGQGNSSITVAQTTSLTPLAANCAVVWAVFDFNATAPGTPTPAPTTTTESTDFGATYSVVAADLTDQASAGAVSYGTTGGTGDYTAVACEVRASAVAAGDQQEWLFRQAAQRGPRDVNISY